MCDIKQEDSDVRSIDTALSFSDAGTKTPSSSDSQKLLDTEYVPSVPCPGKTYKIHLKDTNKVITITEGEVVLQSPAEAQPGGGWYWVCVEKGNWLGFRNHVSGNFLGHNGWLGLHAKVKHHDAPGSFCVRHHPLGGYLLLTKYPWGEEMRQIGCASDGKTLIQGKIDGSQWMFEEV